MYIVKRTLNHVIEAWLYISVYLSICKFRRIQRFWDDAYNQLEIRLHRTTNYLLLKDLVDKYIYAIKICFKHLWGHYWMNNHLHVLFVKKLVLLRIIGFSKYNTCICKQLELQVEQKSLFPTMESVLHVDSSGITYTCTKWKCFGFE